MTPAQLRHIRTAAHVRHVRAALGLTQYELGRLLYLDGDDPARTVRKWEADGPSGPAAKALELIAKEKRIAI